MWDLSPFEGCKKRWNHYYVVFDDIAWPTLSASAKSWFGGQRDFTVSDKYKRKLRMVGGIPCILLANPDQYDGEDGLRAFCNSEWGRENVVVVRLTNKLY